MINKRFLNFKTYNAFQRALKARPSQISEEAIVFVQDKPCIWARGKEYVCDGPYTAYANGQSFTFSNGSDKTTFSVDVDGGTITFTDSNGYTVTGKFASQSSFDSVSGSVSNLEKAIAKKQDVLHGGYGIDISNNTINCTIDGSIYQIVRELPDKSVASSNKIYILERRQDGQYIHEQWRLIDGEWESIGITIQNVDYVSQFNEILDNYATIIYTSSNYQPKGDYATKSYVDETFVKKSQVYNPKQGEWGTDDGTSTVIDIQPGTYNITIDPQLSISSSNPVENKVIKMALDKKADKTDLTQYAKRIDLNDKADKADILTQEQLDDRYKLTAGEGISINNNIISSTIDTELWVLVDALPTENINTRKVYLVQEEVDGDIVYVEYRYKLVNNEWRWVASGQRTPQTDLSAYLTSDTASQTYLEKNDAEQIYQTKINAEQTYLTKSDAEDIYQTKIESYIDDDELEAFRVSLYSVFQRRGGYALASDVSSALEQLQSIIDQKYVLKQDVYNPNKTDWSRTELVSFNFPTPNGSGGSSSGTSGEGSYNEPSYTQGFVTITKEQYQALVRDNIVDPNTYYFTYEEESEWGFGNKFPITFSGEVTESIGEFPITLT